MSNLTTAGAAVIGIGIILMLYIMSESQDCAFIAEKVNVICGSTTNISEKAVYIIASVFMVVLGYVLYKKGKADDSADY